MSEERVEVHFHRTVVVDDARRGTAAEERYEEGRSYRLTRASAQRWVDRRAAVYVGDAVPAPQEAPRRAAPEAGTAQGVPAKASRPKKKA